jgi:hypothetical protein
MGTRGSFRGRKVPGHEADHSPPSSVKVKNGGAICFHLYSLFDDVDIIKRIKINRLRWAEHVIRRGNEEIIKRLKDCKTGREKEEI